MMKSKCIAKCVAAAALFCFVSCGTQSVTTYRANKSESETHTEREYTSKDTAIVVSGDRATIAALIKCDSLGNAYLAALETEHGARIKAEVTAKAAQDELNSLKWSTTQANTQNTQRREKNVPLLIGVDCHEDSLLVVINKQREVIRTYESLLQSDSAAVEVPVEYIPESYRRYKSGFWWLLGILAAEVVGGVAYVVMSKTGWGKTALAAIKLFFKFV